MQAGKLRQRIVIEEQSAGQDTFGQGSVTWTAWATVWAAVEPLAGREYLAARQVQEGVTTRVTIRYRDDVTAGKRITWGTHVYDISSVIADPMHARQMELMCTEVI